MNRNTKTELKQLTPEINNQLKSIVGPNGWIENDAEKAAYLTDERDLFTGKSPLILRPATTDELSRIVKITSNAKRKSVV